MLRYIYKRYKGQFEDFFIESLIGKIPDSINEPSIEFLQNARDGMEKWLLWQSYFLQKRQVNATKEDAMRIEGMLLYIRIIMSIIYRKGKAPSASTEVKEDASPYMGINEFMKIREEEKKSTTENIDPKQPVV